MKVNREYILPVILFFIIGLIFISSVRTNKKLNKCENNINTITHRINDNSNKNEHFNYNNFFKMQRRYKGCYVISTKKENNVVKSELKFYGDINSFDSFIDEVKKSRNFKNIEMLKFDVYPKKVFQLKVNFVCK